MTRISAVLVSTFTLALGNMLAALPAHAQRVFVSGSGSDSNPCTYAAPCRTFAQAFNTAPANGEIDVLDPAGYGPLTITHGISIQAHGFGGITQPANGPGMTAAITINAGASDTVSLNGLLLDGVGTGLNGILVNSGGVVQILNCVVRNFHFGIYDFSSTATTNLSVSDTIASDNIPSDFGTGIYIDPQVGTIPIILTRVAANDDYFGVVVLAGAVVITDSVMANNIDNGLLNNGGTSWLARSTISGNAPTGGIGAGGVYVQSGTVFSYGDNNINGNGIDINGSAGVDVDGNLTVTAAR